MIQSHSENKFHLSLGQQSNSEELCQQDGRKWLFDIQPFTEIQILTAISAWKYLHKPKDSTRVYQKDNKDSGSETAPVDMTQIWSPGLQKHKLQTPSTAWCSMFIQRLGQEGNIKKIT